MLAQIDYSSLLSCLTNRARASSYLVDTRQGLTICYNRLKDPQEDDERVLELRRLHEDLDQAVLEPTAGPTSRCRPSRHRKPRKAKKARIFRGRDPPLRLERSKGGGGALMGLAAALLVEAAREEGAEENERVNGGMRVKGVDLTFRSVNFKTGYSSE